MTEVQAGIHQINTPLGDRLSYVYAFVANEAALIFDTGCSGALEGVVAPYLDSIGVERGRVRWVVVSHCDVDHFGGIGEVAYVFPNARSAAHSLDAPMMEDYAVFDARRGDEFGSEHGIHASPDDLAWMRSVTTVGPVDIALSGSEHIRLSDTWTIDIQHVPGHSQGHLAIWDPRSRSAVVSDAVLSDAVLLSTGEPAFPPTYRHVNGYRGTIAAFSALPFDAMYTAHYPNMDRDSGREFLGTTRAFVDRAEAAVLREFEAGPRTAKDLIAALNPTLGRWPAAGTGGALAFPIVGHLEDLVAAKRLVGSGVSDGATLWRLP